MKVVGMGAQDSLALAQDFVSATGVSTVQMVWDPAFASWSHYGVRSQPFTVVVDGNGSELARFSGVFDGAEVLSSIT